MLRCRRRRVVVCGVERPRLQPSRGIEYHAKEISLFFIGLGPVARAYETLRGGVETTL